jgi:hypothetical protein
MNEIAQIQQWHAGQIEDFRDEAAELYHERGHMLAQINGLRLALRNAQGDVLVRVRRRRIDHLRRAQQTVEGERDAAISEGMVVRGENEALRAEIAQLRSENQKRLALEP